MISNSYVARAAETSGPLSIFGPKRDKFKTPLDKINESLKLRRELKNLQKIEDIKSKEPSERTLEEKILLAQSYAEDTIDKILVVEPKYLV